MGGGENSPRKWGWGWGVIGPEGLGVRREDREG